MSVLARAMWRELCDCIREDPGMAREFAELIGPHLQIPDASGISGWLDTKAAASYLGISQNAMHKLTGARAIPFEQDKPGAKCWFRAEDLDAYRRGVSNSFPSGRLTA